MENNDLPPALPGSLAYGQSCMETAELAFQLFWAWTNHPSEDAARKAWESSDAMSRASWERVARCGMNYLQGVADEA
jgi:hypothetical protein